MAQSTIPQTSPYRPPEKQWYTLQNVADRWTEMTGKKYYPEDVLHFAETAGLFVCALFDSSVEVEWYQRTFDEDGDNTACIEWPYYPYEPLGIFGKDIPPLARGRSVTPRFVYSHLQGARFMDSQEAFITENRRASQMQLKILPMVHKNQWMDIYIYGVIDEKHQQPINRDNLVVTNAALSKFEQAHDLGQPAPNETEPQIIEESAKPAPAQNAALSKFEQAHDLGQPAQSSEEPTKTAPTEAKPIQDWKTRARELGKQYRVKNPRLSLSQIASKVEAEKEFAAKDGFRNRSGKPFSASHILRHALQNLEK